MSFYSIIQSTPTSENWIPEYIESVGQIVSKYGGKYLARTTNYERLEGKGHDPAAFIIIEWPSKKDGESFIKDPVYKPFLESRLSGSISHHFLVDGNDALSSPN